MRQRKLCGVFTGVDAILGVEYKVKGLPFLLSADMKPAVHINHDDWVHLSSGVSKSNKGGKGKTLSEPAINGSTGE